MGDIQHGGINGAASIIHRLTGSVRTGGGKKEVISNTTEGWNSQPLLISAKDTVYVYTDYATSEGQDIPNIKIGDGNAYLIDLPFLVSDCNVTPEDIEKWNNKVSAFLDPLDEENLILSTD